jgi:virginiamycin B lyase
MGISQHREKSLEQRRRLLSRRLLAASIGLIASFLAPSAALAIDEFPVPASSPGGITAGPGGLWFTLEGTAVDPPSIARITTSGAVDRQYPLQPGSTPDQITAGPDGRVWFTEAGRNRIGAINPNDPNPSGLTEYPQPANGGFQNVSGPQGITVGPDGALWFTEVGPVPKRISRITTAGTITHQFPLPGGAGDPTDIVLGLDGRLWFTEQPTSRIGAIRTDGVVTEYPLQPGREPSSIISTAGGILWFTEPGIGAIGRIATSGAPIDEFPGAGNFPSGIAAGRDGALWYTLGLGGGNPLDPCNSGTGDNAIGRITSGGTITNKFALTMPLSDPSDITEGPDGALWFSEFCGNRIGRIATAAPAAPPPPAPPPAAVLSVSSLKLSPSSFKAAPKGASITKKAKPGTRVTYLVSTAASTRFTVESIQAGRKKGKNCVKPTAKNKKGKRCTRYVVVKGSFKHASKAGSNNFRFSGRVGNKRLKPGKYRLVAVATVGARKSKVRRANFTIVR